MPKFGVPILNMAVTTTLKGAIALTTVAGARAEIIESMSFGAGTSAPADVQIALIHSFSDGGGLAAGTATVPEKFDQNSALSIFTTTLVDTELSSEPTTLTTLPCLTYAHNQRGGFRWAVPRGEGFILSFDHTFEDFVMQTDADANGNINPSIHWWEA